MRIAALSDIHGNLSALDAALEDIGRRGADLIVNLGDIVSGPLMPRETAERLMALDLPTIRGNHERQLLDSNRDAMGASDRHAAECLSQSQKRWLEALPMSLRVTDEVFLCHATPESDVACYLEDIRDGELVPASLADIEERTKPCTAALILCGHTHIPRVARLSGGQIVVNPGSVGIQAYEGHHPIPHTLELGSPHARYAIVERAAQGWIVEQFAIPYDWEAAAMLAQRNGSSGWSRALRTGFIREAEAAH